MSPRTPTVLWPSDLSTSSRGVCYGWERPLLLVAGVLPVGEDKEEDVRELLTSVTVLPQWRAVRDMFSSDPTIIGFCEPPVSSRRGAPPSFRLVGNAPALSTAEGIQVVLYQRHRRQTMRFYAFDFTELDILPLQDSAHDPSPSSVKNAEAVLQSDFTRTHAAASRRSASLDAEVLSQANFAQLLADLVERRSRMRDTQPPALSTPLTSTPERPSTPVIPPAAGTSERRSRYEPLRRAASELHVILRDLSTTADQLDVRFEQSIYVAGELPHVYHDKARTVTSISKYIKFHNCVWLVLNDVIIGVAFGSFLCENRRVLAAWLEYVMQHYLVHRMELALLWLNNWPAGLKLNTELSQFYCHSLIGVVSAWGWLLARAAPYFPTVIGAIGIAGCCGMTMIVSLLSDTLSLLTAHLYACYYISATVFRHQLSLAGSLWNLFRGKRYNVLRNRIDSWDYELDQLLLGTILFTLLAFLYPTVLTYYALFATARLAIMMVHAVLDTVTALLNHFPLFALLLRVKDPLRLPGGICIQRTKAGPLLLTSQPAPLSSIFRHYAHLAARLTTHYHPLRMLRQLAVGRVMTPIPRSAIRYSMIPVRGKAGVSRLHS
ncbi:Gpi1-domain-containing protein [Trametes coccinea BRFM310]|uniref:Gpi1-domain-containing protein n=1 Tax=Trametes coccinea (strain BRFM310) TaxID=1353009 RepID=A0A1Y2IJX0_TRAC3|nr:Gpi1-domain-containing protein [Trametes coccinea BRFM310]